MINVLATKYTAIIPSINPFINSFPEKNNINNNHNSIKTLSSSNGINSTFTPEPGAVLTVKFTVDPSPLKTSFTCLTLSLIFYECSR